MSYSWCHKYLVLMTLFALIVISESSRLPKVHWEQMLPKKLPTPSSSPSKGSNSQTTSSKAVQTERKLPSSDGKKKHVQSATHQKGDEHYGYIGLLGLRFAYYKICELRKVALDPIILGMLPWHVKPLDLIAFPMLMDSFDDKPVAHIALSRWHREQKENYVNRDSLFSKADCSNVTAMDLAAGT